MLRLVNQCYAHASAIGLKQSIIIQEIAVILSQGEMIAMHCVRAGIFLQVTTPSFETLDTVYQISYEGAS